MTFYSWTGISRIEGVSKHAFQKLTNLLHLFFNTIIHADPNFSHKEKEEFFRDGVLKHSAERCLSKEEKKQKKRKRQDSDSI